MVHEIIVRKDIRLGVWQGLGGAITEATAYNFAKLKLKKQKELIDTYYGKNGLDYRWGRLSIGSNDFCLKTFEYTKRIDLSDFSIEHDRRWVLPMLKKIMQKKDLRLVASPWSPPRCMKLVWGRGLSGILKPWCYDNYARYIRKWLEAYIEEGIKIDYITPQNEPRAAQTWESCIYSYRSQRKLAYKYLVKELSGLDTKILLWDHNKGDLTRASNKLFTKNHASEFGYDKKVAGLCYHWYDGVFSDQMWQTRQKFSDILMVSSEMSCGFSPYDKLEWRNDANLYFRELFADINSGTSAFIDWNMLLSWQGGPSYCKNYLKSPVILNEKGDDYILTPIYVALRKFVRLFPAGSEVVRCEYDADDIVAVARKTTNGYEVVVANVSDSEQNIAIKFGKYKKCLRMAKYEIASVVI